MIVVITTMRRSVVVVMIAHRDPHRTKFLFHFDNEFFEVEVLEVDVHFDIFWDVVVSPTMVSLPVNIGGILGDIIVVVGGGVFASAFSCIDKHWLFDFEKGLVVASVDAAVVRIDAAKASIHAKGSVLRKTPFGIEARSAVSRTGGER